MATQCGNCYTASLFGGLASLIESDVDLRGKQGLMFAFGSGVMAAMFLIHVHDADNSRFPLSNLTEKVIIKD